MASTSRNATSASAAATASASHGAMSPAASGRSAVRATCASKSRSAQSLNAHPAERISSVPIAKISTQRPARRAVRGEPERGQRRPQQQQRADRLVEPHQPLVRVEPRDERQPARRDLVRRRGLFARVHQPIGSASCFRSSRGATCASRRMRRRIAEPHAQLALHPRVGQPPRLAHERQQHRRDLLLGVLPADSRRARQVKRIGDSVEPRAHLHLAVVADVVRAIRAPAEQRGDDRVREIVGVDVIRVHVVVGGEHRRALLGPLERQARWRVDAGHAQDRQRDAVARRPTRAADLRPRRGGARAASARAAAASRRRARRRNRHRRRTSKRRRSAAV